MISVLSAVTWCVHVDCGSDPLAVYKSHTVLMMSQVKEAPAPGLSGLLTRDLTTGMTRLYRGVEREVELLTESSSIFLPSVTCADRGVYSCHLAAPVGEQNQDGEVLLNVTGKSQSSGSASRLFRFSTVGKHLTL